MDVFFYIILSLAVVFFLLVILIWKNQGTSIDMTKNYEDIDRNYDGW